MNNNNNKQTEKSFCEKVEKATSELRGELLLFVRTAYVKVCQEKGTGIKFPYAFVEIEVSPGTYVSARGIEETKQFFEKHGLEVYNFGIFLANGNIAFEYWIRPKK
jgi:hypothetical protein